MTLSAFRQFACRRSVAAFAALMAMAAFAPAVRAAPPAVQTGSVSGLPLPRYVSLKSDRVNLREGPSKDHRTRWVYQRAGLPVEITAEFETWRRVRDAEGTEGWVLHSLLSGRRTALVVPWEKTGIVPMVAAPEAGSRLVAKLQPGVITAIKSCNGTWCKVTVQNVSGYVAQEKLWGVYPGEKVE